MAVGKWAQARQTVNPAAATAFLMIRDIEDTLGGERS
jgi:hypothetical protein